MKAENKKMMTLFMTGIVIAMILLAGCIYRKPETITSLEGLYIRLINGYVDCDFENNTISYKKMEPEFNQQTTIPPEDAAEYKELMLSLCQEMFDHEDEYNYYPTPDAFVSYDWYIEITYNGGCTKKIDVTEYAKRTYPDNWDEFVTRTNELTGCDVNELLIDPYYVQPIEVYDLSETTLFFDNGLIVFDYDANWISYAIYDSEEEETVDIPPEKIEESKEFMRQFCEEIIVHRDEYCGDLSETDSKRCWKISIFYDKEDELWEDNITITEDSERIYPDNWDELAQLVFDLTGRDITEFMTEPVE